MVGDTHVIVSLWGEGGSILTWLSLPPGFYGQKAGDYENWNGKISPPAKSLDCRLEGSEDWVTRLSGFLLPPSPSIGKNRMILQRSRRNLQTLLAAAADQDSWSDFCPRFGFGVTGGAVTGWRVIAGGWRDGATLPWRRLQLPQKLQFWTEIQEKPGEMMRPMIVIGTFWQQFLIKITFFCCYPFR